MTSDGYHLGYVGFAHFLLIFLYPEETSPVKMRGIEASIKTTNKNNVTNIFNKYFVFHMCLRPIYTIQQNNGLVQHHMYRNQHETLVITCQ